MDKTTKQAIAANLDFLIAQTGIQVQTIAERSGVSIRTVSAYRNGTANNPTIENVDAIARVFKLHNWLLLKPGLPNDYANKEWLDRIASAFSQTTPQGQDMLRKAAEAAELMAAPNPPADDKTPASSTIPGSKKKRRSGGR